MSILIIEHTDQKLEYAYHKYGIGAGALRFYWWKLNEEKSKKDELTDYNIHKVVARQSIEKLNYETARRWNGVISEYKRSAYPSLAIDYDDLDTSGIELTIDEFLGFDYDWVNRRPGFKGKKNGKAWYFDFDKYDYNESKRKLDAKGIEHNRGFIHAFFYPPWGLIFGDEYVGAQEYFDEFTRIIFDKLNDLKIYTWSINCSTFFDFGKEWWGSYFWTVYNPEKNYYIGILASESD